MHSLDSSTLQSYLDLFPLFCAYYSHASGLLRYTLKDLSIHSLLFIRDSTVYSDVSALL